MRTARIKRQLRREFCRVTPNVLDAVLSQLEDTEEDLLPRQTRHKKRRWPSCAAAAAAVLVLCAGLGIYQSGQVMAATVSLDVNPAIEITVNRWGRVLSATGCNADGVTVIGGRNFRGDRLTATVHALVDTMIRQGFLSDENGAVFISVSGNGSEETLSSSLSQSVNEQLEESHVSGEVMSQTVQRTEELERITEEYGVTEGKALFMKLIAELHPEYSYDELSSRSVKELWSLARSKEKNSHTPTYHIRPKFSSQAVRALVLEQTDIPLKAVQDDEYRLAYWLESGERYVLVASYAEGLYQFSTTSPYRGSLYHVVSFAAGGQRYEFILKDFTGEITERNETEGST